MMGWVRAPYDDDKAWDLIPNKPGCYAVYGDGKLLYVGSSIRIRQRLMNHGIHYSYGAETLTNRWGAYRAVVVKYRVVNLPGDWLRREYRLVKRLRPEFCRMHTGRTRHARKAVAA